VKSGSTQRLLNPYDYPCDVLIRIQTHPARDIDAIMPWRWLETIAADPGHIESG
jgi:hypothetical protein